MGNVSPLEQIISLMILRFPEMGKRIRQLRGIMQCGFNSANAGITIQQRVMCCYYAANQKQ